MRLGRSVAGVLVVALAVLAARHRMQSATSDVEVPRTAKRDVAPPRLLAIEPAKRISGRVTSEGAAVGGARVTAWALQPDVADLPCACDDGCGKRLLECGCDPGAEALAEIAEQRAQLKPVAETVSKENGSFALELPESRGVELWAEAPGLMARAVAEEEEATLQLQKTRAVHGAVKVNNEHVATASVVLLIPGVTRVFATTSDADGKYQFEALPKESAELVGLKDGLLPGESRVAARATEEDLFLWKPRVVAGVVRRADQPVPGVEVVLRQRHEVRRTTSAHDGSFRFEAVGGAENVRAESGSDFAELSVYRGSDSTENLALNLAPGGRIAGVVVDELGAPVGGVRLRVIDAAPSLSTCGNRAMADAPVTDSAGRFRTVVLARGPWNVALDDDGYFDAYESVYVEAGRTAEMKLSSRKGEVLAGRVLDSEGRPVSGARVEAQAGGDAASKRGGRGDTWTNERGEFKVQPLSAGMFELAVNHKDFRKRTVQVRAPDTNVSVPLEHGSTLVVRVVDELHGDVSKATVYASSEAGKEVDVTPDESGVATFRGLEDGRYLVVGDLASRFAAANVEVRSSGSVTLKFGAGLPTSGIVLDDEGKPVPEADLEAWSISPAPGALLVKDRFRASDAFPRELRSQFSSTVATSDASGRFTLGGLNAGNVAIKASRSGYLEANPLVISAGATDVRLTLQKKPTLHGRVIDDDGRPVTRFRLNGTLVESREGRYSLDLSRPDAALVITAEGYVETRPRFGPGARDGTELPDIVLHRARKLSGVVVDSTSRAPVSGARVSYLSSNAVGGKPYVARVAGTDPEGRFAFDDVPTGSADLAVEKEGYAHADVRVSAAQEISISLDSGRVAAGLVLDEAGAPRARASIYWLSEKHSGWAETDDAGRFVLKGLPSTRLAVFPEQNAGLAEGYSSVSIPAGTEAIPDILFRAAKAVTVTARVRTSSGYALSYCPDLYPVHDGRPTRPGRDCASSGTRDAYRYDGVLPGAYVFRIATKSPPGFIDVPVEVGSAPVTVEFTVPGEEPSSSFRATDLVEER